MNPKKRILTVVLTLALGLGVWTLAFTFQAADFAEGDVLSASALNTLLNDNFQAASDAVDANVDRAGDTVTGRLNVEAAATSEGDFDAATVFRVENTDASEGSAAIFQGENDADNGVVSIKQNGAGPALSLKANGGGPLIVGAGELDVNFAVDADGSVRIGSMGPDGTDDPTLHLDATAGTVTNDVGSGLPLAFGYVSASGGKVSGTDNFAVTRDGTGAYRITLTGETYSRAGFAAIAQANSPGAHMTRTGANADDLIVEIYDSSGAADDAAFQFVVHKDGL